MKKLILLTAGLVLLFTGCDDLTKELEEAILASNGLQENTLTIKAGSGGSVSPETVIKVRNDVPVTLTATPETDINFQNWEKTDGDGTVAFSAYRDETTTVTLNDGDATVTGNFTANPTGSVAIQNKVRISSTYYSSTKLVNIHFTYSNNAQEMKISESSFIKGSTTGWISASLSSTHTFSSDGNKTLYVRFRDSSGNESDLYSDTIYIDSTAPYFSKYEVDQYSPITRYNTTYVTGIDDSNLRLDYLAYDLASGPAKVYFSRTTSRPSTAQIQNYSNPPALFNWQAGSNTTVRGYYNVYFWVEDMLGNISTYVTKQIRYDDRYEGASGNNTVDSVTSATLDDIHGDGDESSNLYGVGGESAYSIDPDCYKWAFYYSDFSYVNFEVDFNTAESNLDTLYTISFYDHNRDEITPTSTNYNNTTKEFTYSLDIPYVDTSGYPYGLYLSIVRNGTTPPYPTKQNYTIDWNFYQY